MELQATDDLMLDSVPLLSIVLPVYNGSKKIQGTLENVRSRMNDLESIMFDICGSNYDHILEGAKRGSSESVKPLKVNNERAGNWYEIIVVNDGSEDDTRNILERIKQKDEKIKMISYGVNMGKGYAIKQGILESRGKYV
ncbi:MAG: glycosyltransferase, partial [Nitrososphaera sp.]|nr:glycosyltransferase [Nitrososphaera sp.]